MTFKVACVPAKQKNVEVREEKNIYVPGPGEVVIENHAAASNPMDWKLQKYGFWFEEKDYPLVFGVDVAGKISAVGPDVKSFKIGDRVAAILNYVMSKKIENGGYQEYSVTKEQHLTPIPDSISYAEAATLPLGVTSCVVSLYLGLNLDRPSATKKGKKDDFILVWGASSSLGLYAIQLASQAGYKVIATASKHNFDLVKSLGAEFVVDHKDADVVSQLKKYAGKEIKYVYDTIGSEDSIKKSLEAIDPNGFFASVVIQLPSGIPETVKASPLYANLFYDPTHKELADYFFKDFLPAALANGVLKPNPVELIPGWIDATQTLLDTHYKGVSGKKLVIARS